MELKSLAVGLIIGLLISGATIVVAKSITPQGNLDFKGDGAIIDAKNVSIRSPDSTLWTCTVSDLGAFTCTD